MAINAGRMRAQITIEKATTTRDSFGQSIKSWTTHLNNVWAESMSVTGKESYVSDQVLSQSTRKYGIRYIAGLDRKMRVVSNGVLYNIEHIHNVAEKNEKLILFVSEYKHD